MLLKTKQQQSIERLTKLSKDNGFNIQTGVVTNIFNFQIFDLQLAMKYYNWKKRKRVEKIEKRRTYIKTDKRRLYNL